ncbi:hypothetical protein IGK74_001696 [Enterococcus sp. AZ150]|uniref:hypothetical protein n=1 Tax=Enterococcus sp. AZ150 TaxID=2774866 RepID=UPI003F29CCCA
MVIMLLPMLVIIIGILLILLLRKDNKRENLTGQIEKATEHKLSKRDETKKEEFTINIEKLSQTYKLEEDKLIEVKDSQLLTRINMLIPGLINAGTATSNIVGALQTSGDTLYRAIIPDGATLANSSSLSGAKRGIFHGANGIKGHANLEAVDSSNGMMLSANSIAGVMAIASVIVGQYYMTQINNQLDGIQSSLDKILTIENNKYRSSIISLVTQIKVLTDFKMENIENEELRKSSIAKLILLESDCTKNLARANLEIDGIINAEVSNYEEYEKQVLDIQKWYDYQKILLKMLSTISELQYTLNLGVKTREQSEALYKIYADQSKELNNKLQSWHDNAIERLYIDISKSRREREGIDKVFHYIPGMINKELNYVEVSSELVQSIQNQKSNEDSQYMDHSDYYNQDVQLISKEGKVYYLPSNKI